MKAAPMVSSPVNPDWLIPQGWENILGTNFDYRLGRSSVRLWRVQFNRHVREVDRTEAHTHPHHQILYYQQGAGRQRAGGKWHAVGEGTFFFIPAWHDHAFQGAEGREVVCLAMDFTVAGEAPELDEGLPIDSEVAILLSLLKTDRVRPFQAAADCRTAIEENLRGIITENGKRATGYASLIQAHLLALLAQFLRAARDAAGFKAHFRHTSWRHRLAVEQVDRILEREGLSEECPGLVAAARRCGVSPNHLNRILKEQRGRSYGQLMLRHRLAHARQMLASGKFNCSEAAFESGFNDSNYFARAFRKEYGFAPSTLL